MRSNFRFVQGIALFVLLITACRPETATDIATTDLRDIVTIETTVPTDSSAEEETAACKQIIFSYYVLGRVGPNIFDTHIGSVCPDGTDRRRLTLDVYDNFRASWSPDGSEIAFLSWRSGTRQLHLMDQDGGNIRQLTFGPDVVNWSWFWLPDGNRIAALITPAESIGGVDGEGSWQAVDVATKEMIPLTGGIYDFLIAPPVFSHDGARLAYVIRPEQEEPFDGSHPSLQIHIQNIDGSNDYVLINDNSGNSNPVWSPDDSQIAFNSEWDLANDQFTIYIVNVDGSNLHRVIDSSALPRVITEPEFIQSFFFTWSPDGESFAIYAYGSLYILDLKSGETIVLFTVDEPNYLNSLSWQP